MTIDIIITVVYMVLINIIGIAFSRTRNINDYFLGGRSIHWSIVCLSIVATETSSLTFISIPGLSYVTGMGFLQVSLGYLLGRILVAWMLLPRYFEGSYDTVYQFLEKKFGKKSRKIISVIFHITRTLADSVRLVATAIPLTLLTGWDYRISLLVIALTTFLYTFYGGIRSVIITDSLQLVLYIGCAFLGIYFASSAIPGKFTEIIKSIPLDKLKFLYSGFEGGQFRLFDSYNLFSGVIGGAFLSFASHGTDHLIVQRVLSCRDLSSARKAMVASGIFIVFQFALFLIFGLFLYLLFQGRTFPRSDDIIPYFIINHVPTGFRGLMLAGIFAAAMSTLSSTINSLSSSTTMDLMSIDNRPWSDSQKLFFSRMVSLVWTAVLTILAMLLNDTKNPLVEIGLSIASITYGGMLGIFIMGRYLEDFSDRSALVGVFVSIGLNALLATLTSLFWLWYVAIGFTAAFMAGSFHNRISKGRKTKRGQANPG